MGKICNNSVVLIALLPKYRFINCVVLWLLRESIILLYNWISSEFKMVWLYLIDIRWFSTK